LAKRGRLRQTGGMTDGMSGSLFLLPRLLLRWWSKIGRPTAMSQLEAHSVRLFSAARIMPSRQAVFQNSWVWIVHGRGIAAQIYWLARLAYLAVENIHLPDTVLSMETSN